MNSSIDQEDLTPQEYDTVHRWIAQFHFLVQTKGTVFSLSFEVALTCEYYNNLACLNLQGQRDPSMSAGLRQVANGFAYRVRKYSGYDINGYRFRTKKL